MLSGGCESSTHTCTCSSGWTGLGCELPDCAGDPDCNNQGICNDTTDPPHCRSVMQLASSQSKERCLWGEVQATWFRKQQQQINTSSASHDTPTAPHFALGQAREIIICICYSAIIVIMIYFPLVLTLQQKYWWTVTWYGTCYDCTVFCLKCNWSWFHVLSLHIF